MGVYGLSRGPIRVRGEFGDEGQPPTGESGGIVYGETVTVGAPPLDGGIIDPPPEPPAQQQQKA